MASQTQPLVDEQILTLKGHVDDIDTAVVTIKADLDAIAAALPQEE